MVFRGQKALATPIWGNYIYTKVGIFHIVVLSGKEWPLHLNRHAKPPMDKIGIGRSLWEKKLRGGLTPVIPIPPVPMPVDDSFLTVLIYGNMYTLCSNG